MNFAGLLPVKKYIHDYNGNWKKSHSLLSSCKWVWNWMISPNLQYRYDNRDSVPLPELDSVFKGGKVIFSFAYNLVLVTQKQEVQLWYCHSHCVNAGKRLYTQWNNWCISLTPNSHDNFFSGLCELHLPVLHHSHRDRHLPRPGPNVLRRSERGHHGRGIHWQQGEKSKLLEACLKALRC